MIAFVTLPAVAQDKNPEHALARQVLSSIQQQSVSESREYCGFIGYDNRGFLRATTPGPGTHASCLIKEPPPGWRVTASYHTHGGWTERYDDEVPSTQDMYSDIDARTNGYIATPGGRIWFFDYQREVAYQLCGLGCLYQDPDFTARGSAPVRDSYTLNSLSKRFGE